jgi:hypothetical protein
VVLLLKGLDFNRVYMVQIASEDECLMFKPDVEGSLLTSKFEFAV